MSPERGKVRILWGDGSRAQAHNLDDLYLRWMMRRGTPITRGMVLSQDVPSPAARQDSDIDFAQFDFTNPPTIKHARDWQTLIKNHVDQMEAMPKEERAREVWKDERIYLLACRRILKVHIIDWSTLGMNEVFDRSEKVGDVSTALLTRSFQLITRMLANGAEISDEDRKMVDFIRDHLLNKGTEYRE